MNSKKAKALRKKVYGDSSLKGKREYGEKNHRQVKGGITKTIFNQPDTLRAKYQKAKKEVS